MAKAICAIDDCERPADGGRGWCKMHWARWRRTGDPTKTRKLYRLESTVCVADDCERAALKKNLCNTHYWRWWLHGDPNRPRGSQLAERNNNWRGYNIAYQGAHDRVERMKGPIASLRCIDCGDPAEEWSYNNAADIEIIDGCGRRYSAMPDDYDPRCCPCHERFDKAARERLRA